MNLKKLTSLVASSFLALGAVSLATPVSATLTLNVQGESLIFQNPDYVYGETGSTYLYENIVTVDGHSVDALLTVDAIDTGTDVWGIDEPGTNAINSYIWINCDICDPDEEDEQEFSPADGYSGYAQFTIDFYEAGTQTPVVLRNVSFNVRDIDTYQYIEVLDPDKYVFDEETELTAVYPETNQDIAAGHVRFQEIEGDESEPEDQPFWVEIKFNQISSLTYKIGQDTPTGAFYSVNFSPADFENPVEYNADLTTPVPMKLSKKVFFDGDSAYLKPMWFKKLDKMIASVPVCAVDIQAEIISGVKKAKSEVKGSNLAERRAAIVKKFLTKRGLNVDITLKPNGKGKKAKNNQRFAKIVVSYDAVNCR